MLIHHIKPDQLTQLEKYFGKYTIFGWSIQSWLHQLRVTAMAKKNPIDFDVTLPGSDAVEGRRPRSF
jgi:hypothetical protein